MSTLRVTGLTRSFGDQVILSGVDLDVRGGITAVLGRSGCGKTTLLRLVAGFLTLGGGTIAIDDRTVSGPDVHVPVRRRRVGYVPQEGALFPHLDVSANIAFGLAGERRGNRRGERVSEMLELVGLPVSHARRYPHELSGGQQQRVALARALAVEPTLVLLDEPFSSLDPSLREETGRAVADALRNSNATAVLVTHDRGEAMSLADQVAVMAAGRFLQVAPPVELYLSPATASVASFVTDAVLLQGIVDDGVALTALGRLEMDDRILKGLCTVAVRPEQVEIVQIHDVQGGVPARVHEVRFFGSYATVVACLEAPASGDASIVTARVPVTTAPLRGDRVNLRVDGPVRAFRTSAGEAS